MRQVEMSPNLAKPSSLEDWLALELGPGLSVRRASDGGVVVSRLIPETESLPLFEEAILLAELRAVVRTSGVGQNGEVAFRNGRASVTIKTPIRRPIVKQIVSRIMANPGVSELRVNSLVGGD